MSEWKREPAVSEQNTSAEPVLSVAHADPFAELNRSADVSVVSATKKRREPARTASKTTKRPTAKSSSAKKSADQPSEATEKEQALVGEVELIHTDSPRYTKDGRRRGRHRYAAPLGFFILVFAVIGVVSLTVWSISAIRQLRDTTALQQELYDFLEPIMLRNPVAFEDGEQAEQDSLLLAAIWRITRAEQIRQLQEKDDTPAYQTDEHGRLIIPIGEVLRSYTDLFGEDAVPSYRTIGEEDKSFSFEYNRAENCYYVPSSSAGSSYVPVFDTFKKRHNTVTIRVGYVLNSDITYDNKGNPITPSPEQAVYFQVYTVQQTDAGWRLASVADVAVDS